MEERVAITAGINQALAYGLDANFTNSPVINLEIVGDLPVVQKIMWSKSFLNLPPKS